MATLTIMYKHTRMDGGMIVRFRIRSGATSAEINPHIDLRKGEYKEYPDGRVKVLKDEIYFRIMDLYNDYEKKMRKIVTNYQFRNPTAKQILADLIAGENVVSEEDLDLFVFAERYLEEYKPKSAPCYRAALNAFGRYVGGMHYPMNALSVKVLDGFKKRMQSTPRAQSLYLGIIRHLYRTACLKYNTDTDMVLSVMLFERFKVPKSVYVGQRALTVDEVRAVFACKAKNKREILAKDCAMISFCLIGMNAVDMYTATDYDGKRIAYNRMKTKDRRSDRAHIEVTVHNIIRHLMDRYRDRTGKYVFNFSSRYASANSFNISLNAGLRSIAKRLGMEKLQFYQFRHSWASIARNDLRADAYTVDEALNHKSMTNRLLDVYVKKDFGIINDLNKRVIDYVFGGMNGREKVC